MLVAARAWRGLFVWQLFGSRWAAENPGYRCAIGREAGTGGMATDHLAHDVKHDLTTFTLFHKRDKC